MTTTTTTTTTKQREGFDATNNGLDASLPSRSSSSSSSSSSWWRFWQRRTLIHKDNMKNNGNNDNDEEDQRIDAKANKALYIVKTTTTTTTTTPPLNGNAHEICSMEENDFRQYMRDFLEAYRQRAANGDSPPPLPRLTTQSCTFSNDSDHSVVDNSSVFSSESMSNASFPTIMLAHERECNVRIGWWIAGVTIIFVAMPVVLWIFRNESGSWPWEDSIVEDSRVPSATPTMAPSAVWSMYPTMAPSSSSSYPSWT